MHCDGLPLRVYCLFPRNKQYTRRGNPSQCFACPAVELTRHVDTRSIATGCPYVYIVFSLSCPPIIGLVLLIQSYINPTSSSQCLVNLSTGHATHCGNWPIRTLDTQGIAAGCPYMYVISFALFCRPFFSTTRRSASTALTVVAYLSVHLSHESLVRKNVDTASSQHV